MFTHLHTHTEYSLLDGSNKIKNYISRVKELNMNSAAITDHGNMFGVINFYKEAVAQGIKPIIGCEVYVAPNSRFDKELTGGDDRYYHLILLAENNQGYSNLIKIVSAGYVEGFYYKPRVDMEILNKYHEGIICLSACLAGEVSRYIQKGMYDEAKKQAVKYRDCFGEGNYFLELQDHGLNEQKSVNQALLRMSSELNIPLVVTNDVHYTYADDVEAHDLLLCIQTGKRVTDENRLKYEGGQYYVKSEEELRAIFPYALEAIENAQKIADRCNVTIEFGHYKLPHFEVPEGYTSRTYIEKLCQDGLEKKFPDVVSDPDKKDELDELNKRIDYELSVIDNLGFVDYFLIVSDFIRYAKNNGVSVGPGRGSAAGSLVSYCLDIININPIKYDLYFERFLNPYRTSMPDIDTDFHTVGRAKVMDYVVEKYGRDHVCQIITFGTLAAKNVIKDVVRVLNKPIEYGNYLAGLVPKEPKMTLEKALAVNPEFKEKYENDEDVKYIIDMCKRLEGLPRQSSIHAAGVLIAPEAIDEFIPLAKSNDENITTQFEAPLLEELGLLKMDFLGLTNLDTIDDAIANIKKNKGIEIDIEKIDFEDENVYRMIGNGKTEGVFQLESAGMTNFMMRLKPKCLEDIIAGIALYRPGTMPFIDTYINVRNSPYLVSYKCPQLEPILKPTAGCIIYQEQAMRIVQDLAGFPMGLADEFRRAISKKKEKVMLENREKFIHGGQAVIVSAGKEETVDIPGCVNNGIDEQTANEIYDQIVEFSKYAFNKSHAAAYAHITFETAYLRYHYPVEYMAALISSAIGDTRKVPEYIKAIRAMGIKILPPNINEGSAGFSAFGDKMLFGLAAIRGVGANVINVVTKERDEHGKFKNLEDFIKRLSSKEVNKRTIEALIKAGAFDCFGYNRNQFYSVYESIINKVSKDKKDAIEGQMTLFDLTDDEGKTDFGFSMPDVPEFDDEEKLRYEKEVLGVYVSGHPLEKYAKALSKHTTHKTTDFYRSESDGSGLSGMGGDFDVGGEPKVKNGEKVIVGGIIESLEKKYAKASGKPYAIAQISDIDGTIECMIWNSTLNKIDSWLKENDKVIIEGKASVDEDKDGKINADNIYRLSDIGKTLWIQFELDKTLNDSMDDILSVLKKSEGHDVVKLYSRDLKKRYGIDKYKVDAEEIMGELVKKYGEDNVKFAD